MKIYQLRVKNYKSFKDEQVLNLYGSRYALIGRNNSGKSSLINAIHLILGAKDPRYMNLDESYYFDTSQELLIEITLVTNDLNEIWDLPTTKKNKGIFAGKFNKDPMSAQITLTINHKLDGSIADKFLIRIAGFPVHQKVADLRNSLAKNVVALPNRSAKEDLTASKWTSFGTLMKSILESSPRYEELQNHLEQINVLIEEMLNDEKTQILDSSQIITFIEDIKFQLTKENKPSELLRNLELFVKENNKFFHISDTGTGTQSTIIIAILELALKHKATKSKLLCIEEPELFIHPQGVRFLSQLIDRIITETECQVIVSSHSPIFISGLDPRSIIRIEKSNDGSLIHQLPSNYNDEDNKIKRSLNSENAEMFFSSNVVLVEGETEKILFSQLSENLKSDDGKDLNYFKNNCSVCSVGGKDNIGNYIEILKKYNIPVKAVVDDDYLDMEKSYRKICDDNAIDKTLPKEDLRQQLINIGVRPLSEGETEDLIPNADIATLTGISEEDIIAIKEAQPKTSKALEKKIFKKTKPEIAYDISEYYQGKGESPFDEIIKWGIE
ncbi:MAG: AAA family ATPase [Cyclobacteriaceae bacterium]